MVGSWCLGADEVESRYEVRSAKIKGKRVDRVKEGQNTGSSEEDPTNTRQSRGFGQQEAFDPDPHSGPTDSLGADGEPSACMNAVRAKSSRRGLGR